MNNKSLRNIFIIIIFTGITERTYLTFDSIYSPKFDIVSKATNIVDGDTLRARGIAEAPNEEAVTKALLSWGSKGLLRTETLTGFSPEKMIELVNEI